MRNSKAYILIMLTLLLLTVMQGCGYDRFGEYRPSPKEYPLPNMDIADIAKNYQDKPLLIKDDIIIAGRVTANDLCGNFYRSFIIEDHTGAIEVKAGFYSLHNTYAEGRLIVIKAKGLTVGSYQKVLQIGLPSPEGGAYEVDYFGYRAVMNRYVYPQDDFSEIEPLPVDVEQIGESLYGRLIRIDKLELKEGEEGAWATAKSQEQDAIQGNRVFFEQNRPENEITVSTSGYADFAAEQIPLGRVSITGVVMRGRVGGGAERLIIKMRSSDDCQIF